MFPFTGRIAIPPDVMIREVAGESVILNLNTEIYFGLDEIGTRMLTLLTASGNVQEAYETLLAEYDVDPEILKQDLTKLIDELRDHGLITISDA